MIEPRKPNALPTPLHNSQQCIGCPIFHSCKRKTKPGICTSRPQPSPFFKPMDTESPYHRMQREEHLLRLGTIDFRD